MEEEEGSNKKPGVSVDRSKISKMALETDSSGQCDDSELNVEAYDVETLNEGILDQMRTTLDVIEYNVLKCTN